MSALGRVARRIGMERGERHWYDPEGGNIYFHALEEIEGEGRE